MSVGAVNKQTGERIPTAGMPAIDSVLSGTSTNPVQNKVVKEALDDKQDALTFDDTPTDGSNNPVKSNGIYDALATKADTDMVAADFNAGTSYTAGNYCVQDGKLYKFKNNHSGAWSSADVDEVKITGELSSLKSGLTWQNVISSVSFATDITVADARAYATDNMFILTFLLDISSIADTGEIVIGSVANTYAPSGKWRFTGMSYSEMADSGTANMISLATNGTISVEHTGNKPYIEGTLIVPLIN